MATDILEIFGDEFTGVTGFKATDDNGNTKTYIRPDGNVSISQSGSTDVTNYATATVPMAVQSYLGLSSVYITENNQRKWRYRATQTYTNAGYVNSGTTYGDYNYYNAIPTGTSVIPTTSAQTIGGADYMMEGAVTVAAVSQTNLTADNIKSGTTITISNGQSNLWSVTGTYSGGGGSSTVASKTATLSSAANTISFTQLSGTPIAWFARCVTQLTSSGSTTYYYVDSCRYNGNDTAATLFRIGSTRRIQNQTGSISYTYSNGTLTITTTATSATATPGFFYNGTYELTYVY